MIQKPATEREELFKIQQEREKELLKIQQQRMNDSKTSKRERGVIQNPARERARAKAS